MVTEIPPTITMGLPPAEKRRHEPTLPQRQCIDIIRSHLLTCVLAVGSNFLQNISAISAPTTLHLCAQANGLSEAEALWSLLSKNL